MKAFNQPLDDRIVECYSDESEAWHFHRFRDDKKESNHITTVESVIGSIRDGVTKQDLVSQQGRIREEWKRREASAREISRKEKLDAANAKVSANNARENSAINGGSGTKRKFDGELNNDSI